MNTSFFTQWAKLKRAMQNTEAQCPNTWTKCVRARVCKWARAHCDDVIRIYNRVTRAEHSPDRFTRTEEEVYFVCMGGASLMHRQLEKKALEPKDRQTESWPHTHTLFSLPEQLHTHLPLEMRRNVPDLNLPTPADTETKRERQWDKKESEREQGKIRKQKCSDIQRTGATPLKHTGVKQNSYKAWASKWWKSWSSLKWCEHWQRFRTIKQAEVILFQLSIYCNMSNSNLTSNIKLKNIVNMVRILLCIFPHVFSQLRQKCYN